MMIAEIEFQPKERTITVKKLVVAALGIAGAVVWSGHVASAAEGSRFWIQAEGAGVWQTRNDVQIPSDTGTRFSLVSLGKGPVLGYRAYLGYQLSERHQLRALYAPLTLEVSDRLDSAVNFQGETFNAGQEATGSYRFNSYRLTYRYGWVQSSDWTVDVGFTGKIRDAEIRLTQGATTASRANVGFVPLLHLHVNRAITDRFSLDLDFDGLWSPFGRAEDLALFGVFRISDGWNLLAGYRTVEGGSEGGGKVYNFAWLHFATLGLRVEI